jgi:hypothetical protein
VVGDGWKGGRWRSDAVEGRRGQEVDGDPAGEERQQEVLEVGSIHRVVNGMGGMLREG